MKTTMKRLFSLLLVLVMLGSMLPAVYADGSEEPVVLTDEDYAITNDVFARIDAMEDAPAKKSASRTQITDAAAEIVMASENYVEGSLERNGNSFTWWTEEGIRCIYNPYMREKYANMQAPADAEPSGIYNEPKATKGGWPTGNQVYLIGPYYGIDDSFTSQYKNEAKSIATAIGDTDGYTLYSGTSVTIDKVADAIESGAVVIFDSHGTTDYDGRYVCDDPDGYEVYDYVSKAKYSYLCLTSKTGLTTEDYTDGATYFTDADGYMCACVNGAAIANHMEKNSPAGLLWMAICLGMATNTMCQPMREKGVEVVYGYSQSVTFAGDYCFEETFWDNMIAGKNVATSVAAMKSKWGGWDWSEPIAASYGYPGSGYTLTQARKYRAAFPIVVSDEDTHPGQRDAGTNYGACSEQTVKSTYTLFSQYSVTAKTNNAAWGTVSASGNVITAKPASGYFAQGYTVTSGSATVEQNGNTFTVTASSDCTVQINFAAKTAVTVSFSGANVASQSGYAGDSMNLPTVEAPEGYKFLGWMSAPLSGDTTEKPTFYTGSFVPTGNTTLYALYSYVEASADGGSGDYVKVTETPDDWSGEYLIVYEAGSRVFDGSRSTLEAVSNYQDVTISNNTISAEEADSYRFIIAPMNGGYSVQSASGLYISGTSGSNKLTAGTTPALNTITIDASGNADIVSYTSHLRYNATSGQDRFRYYKSTSYSSQKALALYVKDGSAGTTYYTTNIVKCSHGHTENVAEVKPTCTANGFTAGVYCNDCQTYISGHEEIPASGHSYEAVVTPPTATQQGYTTYTCFACGHSYVGDYVEALGETFTVSFVVPAGVSTIADMTCGKNGITLPSADVPTGVYDYTFAGWVDGTVNNETQKPDVYTGTFTTKSDVTLYALYTYAVGGSGNTEYTLTDLANIDPSDSVVITVTSANGTVYAMSNAQGTSKAPEAVIVNAANGKLTQEPADTIKWNIGGSADAYILYPQGSTATWLYCTNTNNGVRVGTNAATFKIDAATGYLYNNNTGRYLGVYTTNPDWRCYTNTTGNTAGQTLGFYVKGQGGTIYYTTEIVAPCSHENTTTTTIAATCTENGSVTTSCDDCGDILSTELLTASGHSYTLTGNTYTCGNCGDSYNIFYVSFSVPAGVSAVAKMEYTDGGIILPSADVPTGEHTYTFVGWAEQSVSDTTEKPVLYPAGSAYQTDKAVTLQAVYAYAIADDSNSGNGDYVKVTETPDDWSGEYLIVHELDDGTGYVFNGSLTTSGTLSKANNYVTLEISGNTISAADGDAYKFIIASSGDAYTIQANSGMYIGRDTDTNGLNASESTAYTNTLALDNSGNAAITSQAGTFLRFNATTVGSYMFRYYKTGQQPVALYRKNGASTTTYYTTFNVDANLKFYQIGLSFATYIGVQPMMLTSAVKGYDSYYVEAVQTTANGVVTTVLEPTSSTSAYNVYDLQMLPRAMTDSITLTIYAQKNGVTYRSLPVETSITNLALEKIADYQKKEDLGACKVLVDMLVYGTQVQNAFNYKITDVPENYIGEYAALGSPNAPEISGSVAVSGSGIRVYANSLSLGSMVEVQFMFKTVDVAGRELRYSVGGETFTISAEDFDTTVMSGYSVAAFAIKPRNFRDDMTIAVYDVDTDEPVSAVYTASIEDYAAGNVTKYPTLIPAMMNYGDAVLARFPG